MLAVGLVVYAVFMFGCVLNGHGDLNPLLLIFVGLFGLVLLAKAAQLVGMLERWWFRVGVIVDRRRRVASKCWGFLVPLSLFEYDLDVYDSLFVVQENAALPLVHRYPLSAVSGGAGQSPHPDRPE